MQTAVLERFITFVFSVVGHKVCEWFFNNMEMLVPHIQALIIRFIQRNWKQLVLSLLLFVNVEKFMIVSKAVNLYQIRSTLFDVDHQEEG